MQLEILHETSNTIRFLAADGVERANSGHPGMPMGTADIAAVLWSHFLNFNPETPHWINRDRFILSAGHGSMLLYSLLYLYGYDVTMDDLKSFRQFGSKTPGHPEKDCLAGVECTTGPLGQGFAMGVGAALASKIMAEQFNTDDFTIIDNMIYSIVSDGDLMEGVTSEAASLAGHLKLDNMIYIYDNNKITIEGSTDLSFTEDVRARFLSYGWNVLKVDGHDHKQLFDALTSALSNKGKPVLIIADTHIAKGSPNLQDKAQSHGSPLGAEELKLSKKNLNWPENQEFFIPENVKAFCESRIKSLKENYQNWQKMFDSWSEKYPEKKEKLAIFLEKRIPDNLLKELCQDIPEKDTATRVSSGNAIQSIGKHLPFTVGGSADLEPSIKTHIKNSSSILPSSFKGRNIHFGIREHAMGSILNGIALYGGLIPYGSTFLVFSDYMRPAIRLSALMRLQVIYIFSHDSIFLGEDGPTHQPVEHIGSLRLIPNLKLFRPADALETGMSWFYALKRKEGPTTIILTRHNVPQLKRRQSFNPSEILRGGYIIEDSDKSEPDLIIMATGSEVHLAQKARHLLLSEKIDARIVSVPSLEVFEEQDETYKNDVIPEDYDKIVAIEAGRTRDWDKYIGRSGLFIGMSGFGESAPMKELANHFGFTPEKITKRITEWLR